MNSLQFGTQPELPRLRQYFDMNYLSPSTSFENGINPGDTGNEGKELMLSSDQYRPIIEQDEIDFYEYK